MGFEDGAAVVANIGDDAFAERLGTRVAQTGCSGKDGAARFEVVAADGAADEFAVEVKLEAGGAAGAVVGEENVLPFAVGEEVA